MCKMMSLKYVGRKKDDLDYMSDLLYFICPFPCFAYYVWVTVIALCGWLKKDIYKNVAPAIWGNIIQ